MVVDDGDDGLACLGDVVFAGVFSGGGGQVQGAFADRGEHDV